VYCLPECSHQCLLAAFCFYRCMVLCRQGSRCWYWLRCSSSAITADALCLPQDVGLVGQPKLPSPCSWVDMQCTVRSCLALPSFCLLVVPLLISHVCICSYLIHCVCGAHQGSDKQSEVRIKKFMTMMDSMTEKELNTNDIKVLTQPSRILRISRGAGRTPQDYHELLGGSLSL